MRATPLPIESQRRLDNVPEQTNVSVRPEELVPVFPVTLVLGGERSGVSPEVIEAADVCRRAGLSQAESLTELTVL